MGDVISPSRCFEAMVQALVDVPEEIAPPARDEDEKHESSPPPPPTQLSQQKQHMSLAEADPAGFYCDAAFFANAPARPSRDTCTRCGNSEATVVCFSCSRFQGDGGKYCCDCFETYHPFYRVKHKWARMGDLDHQTYRASVERNIADIQGLLHVASGWESELLAQDADTKGDDAVKEVARLGEALSIKIRDLKGLTCEDEDRTKVSTIASNSVEARAQKFQKKYEEREVADAEAGGVGGSTRCGGDLTEERHTIFNGKSRPSPEN